MRCRWNLCSRAPAWSPSSRRSRIGWRSAWVPDRRFGGSFSSETAEGRNGSMRIPAETPRVPFGWRPESSWTGRVDRYRSRQVATLSGIIGNLLGESLYPPFCGPKDQTSNQESQFERYAAQAGARERSAPDKCLPESLRRKLPSEKRIEAISSDFWLGRARLVRRS